MLIIINNLWITMAISLCSVLLIKPHLIYAAYSCLTSLSQFLEFSAVSHSWAEERISLINGASWDVFD